MQGSQPNWPVRIGLTLEHFSTEAKQLMSTVMNSRHTGSANDVIRMRNSRPGASHTQSDTPPSSPVQTDARASRACCFCWCCCCTCSW
ncbi:hypothetical protein DPMN_040461 [Dreissena polymorpha]|uniref:Uncharacterized protein n=1 Tax=Dreissena polymorpha TaxID=45954 RepID=A0A9D4CWY3_DREPO|nr:hypothetical protein DPMN_040461 [Dreissena polymorpha]